LNYIKTSGSGKLVVVLDGINEFTAIGRDASKLFNNINHFLAAYQSFDELKIIITFRSDTLNFFLPGGKLPVDAIEELFYRQGTLDYYEIGKIAPEDGLKLLEVLKVPSDKAKSIMDSLKENLRTPQVLYKIASGAIAPEDLKGMDSLKITGRFLEKRLGRDKELRKICYDLVDVMGKAKDMNLTEEQLSTKAPKLLAKLKANNNHFLNVLSDLEIIQQIKLEDQAGNPSSAILLAHDTIFEALSKGVDKSAKKNKTIPMVITIALILFSVVMMNKEKNAPDNPQIAAINQKVDKAILEFDSTLTIKYPVNATNEIADQTIEKIKSAYYQVFESYRNAEIGYRKMTDKFGNIAMFAMVLYFVGLIFLSGFYLPKILIKIDKRESRIQFFGKNEKFKLFKFYQRLTLVGVLFIIILMAGLQFAGLKESQVSFLTISTFIIYLLYVSLFLPFLVVTKTINKCKESPLVNEYFLSKFGRYMIRFEHLFNLGIAVIFLPLLFIMLKISPSVFYPENEFKDLQMKIRTDLSSIDTNTIKQYPIPSTLPVHEFVNSNGLSLEKKYGQTMEEKLDHSLKKEVIEIFPKRMNGEMNGFRLTKIYLYLIIGLTLLPMIINILPFEIAARKYYKTT
jgi:hypothetical protein